MKFKYIIIIGSLLLFGCSSAQKSSEVQAQNVSVAPYLRMDCKELATESSSLVDKANALRSRVDSEYQSDKNVELVTWILFAPAAFWLDGNAEAAAEYSSIQGQLNAVQEAQKINQCTL
jgi:outer membrane murein-binding lipoprotein Lpp